MSGNNCPSTRASYQNPCMCCHSTRGQSCDEMHLGKRYSQSVSIVNVILVATGNGDGVGTLQASGYARDQWGVNSIDAATLPADTSGMSSVLSTLTNTNVPSLPPRPNFNTGNGPERLTEPDHWCLASCTSTAGWDTHGSCTRFPSSLPTGPNSGSASRRALACSDSGRERSCSPV